MTTTTTKSVIWNKMVRPLLALLLTVWLPAASLGQSTLVKGNIKIGGISRLGGAFPSIFFGQLPLNWVNAGLSDSTGFCSPPGGVFDAVKTIPGDYPATFAGLRQAKVDQNAANKWWLLQISAGTNIHGSGYDSDNALISWPYNTTTTKCLVIRSSTHNTDAQIVCAHGLPGFGAVSRATSTNCSNDGSKFWKLTIDSTPVTGHIGMNFGSQTAGGGGASYILVEDMEIAPAPGSAQSAQGVKVVVQISMNGGDHIGFAYDWIHGWNPGDAGQPGAASGNAAVDNATGVCLSWNRSGTVNTSGTSVTWVSGDRFGMDFSDGTHSPGYPRVLSSGSNAMIINGTSYSIANSTGHDPAVSDTTLTLATSAGNQTGVPFTHLQNPSTQYNVGCGDDSRGVQASCTNCFIEYSQFNKIHWWNSESHAITAGFSNGPVQVAANYIEGGSGGVFSGGGDIDIRGGPQQDFAILGNYIGRDNKWRFLSAGSGKSPAPPFGCGPLDGNASHATCPFKWSIKNNIELKQCNRCLIWGTILESVWPDGQSGYLILLTARAASGGETAGVYDPVTGLPLTVLQNVRFQDVWLRNAPQLTQISPRALSPGNGGGVSAPVMGLDYIDVLATNVGDDLQWGNSGPDIFQWAASGQAFFATMSRSNGIATANASPNNLANFDPGLSNVGTYSNSVDISSVVRSGSTVTMKLNGERHDPTIGGNVVINVQDWASTTNFSNTQIKPTVNNASGFLFSTGVNASGIKTGSVEPNWGSVCATTCTDGGITWTNTTNTSLGVEGTFAVVDVQNSGTNARCSKDINGNPQTPGSAASTEDQPCVKNDGTFGDTITYADARSNLSLCTTLSDCNTKGMNITLDTLSYKITDISPNDGVFVRNCVNGASPGNYEVGATSRVTASTGTDPNGLTVNYPNAASPDPDSSGTVCVLENSSGWPANASVQSMTVLGLDAMAIGSNGQDGQHYQNHFFNNIFITPAGTNTDLTCGGIGGQGSAVYPCWDSNTFQFFNNVLPLKTLAQWDPFPAPFAVNTTPATVTCSGAIADPTCMGFASYMNGNAFPAASCTYNGTDPDNCPMMTQPWSSNFSLSSITPVITSAYQTQGANLVTLQNSFTATKYTCPAGANCGTTGPKPY